MTVLIAVIGVPLRSTPPAESADAVLARLATKATPSPSAREQSASDVDDPLAGAPLPQVVRVTAGDELFVPLGTVQIPRTGLAVPVYNGVQSGVLELGVGQWPGTTEDRLVFSGHRTTYGAPFRDLDLLQGGDEILLTRGAGQQVRYEVFETQVVAEADYVQHVLSEPADPAAPIITLFACHPKGSRSHRIVVRARAAQSPPAVPDPGVTGNA